MAETDLANAAPVQNAQRRSFDPAQYHMENVFISISGLIGAGKSTLAKALGKELNLPVYFEPVIDNVYLQDFYADMAKYAFPLQVYLLNRRFEQQQQIVWSGKGGVQDRTIYEDSVFARMLYNSGMMEERDYKTYLNLFNNMSNFMKKPNIIVHLHVTPEESLERIKQRSRGCESGVSIEYLRALYTAYEEFIQDIARVIPVIKVDYSKFRTAGEMATQIKKEYQRIQNIRFITFEDRAASKSRSKSPAFAAAVKENHAAAQSAAGGGASAGPGAGAASSSSSSSGISSNAPSSQLHEL